MGREVKNFVLENPDVIIGMIPVIGDLYDAVSGLIGVDPLTGRKLSKAEWGLALGAGLLGLFTGADELMDGLALLGRAANKLSPAKLVGKGLDIADKGLGALKTGAKALREIGQAGLSQVDELAQTVSRFGRNAGQVADEVAAAAVDAGRLADNADEAALSLSRMDELMGEQRMFSQVETRAALTDGTDSGTLSERLTQKRTERLRTNLEESKAAREASGFRQWVEDVESKALGRSTDNTPRVVVELGAGDYSNAIAYKLAHPNDRVIATNLVEEWEYGKLYYEHFGKDASKLNEARKEFPQVRVYEGWLKAKEVGVEVGITQAIENKDVASGIGDVVYTILPYPHTATFIGEDAAKIAKTDPGTIIAVTEGGSRSSERFIEGVEHLRPGVGEQFKFVSGTPYGKPHPSWESGPYFTQEYVVR